MRWLLANIQNILYQPKYVLSRILYRCMIGQNFNPSSSDWSQA